MSKRFITLGEVASAASLLVDRIARDALAPTDLKAYAVPRGGIPALLALLRAADRSNKISITATTDLAQADIIVDDLIDSGSTMTRHLGGGKPFYALFAKSQQHQDKVGLVVDPDWLVFPWEVGDKHDESAFDVVTRALEVIGDDPSREGLLETPKRVVKAWETWFGGYDMDPESILKVFADGAEGVDEMVIEVDIPFYTHCEHHMAPFFGLASVAYIPNGRVLGLSKMNRIVDMFARRLQVQERLTNQIADALDKHLQPKGVGVLLRARHMCVESRGVRHRGCSTTTSALRGAIKDEPEARQEFLMLAKTDTPI